MDGFYLKLAILAASITVLALIALTDWNKYKHLILYLLIAMFAQTGFSYNIQTTQGIFPTSAAELLYFCLLFVILIAYLDKSQAITKINIENIIYFYLLCTFIGIITALYFNIKILNIAIEVKSYFFYTFYLFLVPFLTNDTHSIKKCLYAFVFFSIIPMVYILPNLHSLSAIQSQRLDFAEYWGPLNVFAGYILPVFFIALILMYTSSGFLKKGFLFLFISVCVYTLFYSQTRTAWISFVISFLLFTFLSQKKSQVVFVVFILIFAILVSGKSPIIKSILKHRIVDQTLQDRDSSLQKRIDRWNTAWSTFRTYPVTGSGWGGYLIPIGDGRVSNISYQALPRWHNSFFEIMSQLGLLGLISFYLIWFKIIKMSFHAWITFKDSTDGIVLAGLISAVVSILIYSFGEQQFFRIETASVSWFVTGLLMAQVIKLNSLSELSQA